jgi:hypothetical protein
VIPEINNVPKMVRAVFCMVALQWLDIRVEATAPRPVGRAS